MDRRALFFLLIASSLTLSGCAALAPLVADDPSEARALPADIPKTTPAQAYDAGVLDVERGDYDGARREWNRCLAMATPDSSLRVDCLVALEKLAVPGSLQP